MFKLGIIREGKTPPDERVPLTPEQCALLKKKYPELQIAVESSPIRSFADGEYSNFGIEVVDDLSECDVLFGVKEVPIEMLIPEKTYLFFSHTYKKQPYNRDLLKAILDRHIRLIDYELLNDEGGRRLIGFGRYAGIVGAYNGLLAAGKKLKRYELKPAHQCDDRREVERELTNIDLPNGFKIVITGGGRVAGGAMEILNAAGLRKINPSDFLNKAFEEPVYTQLGVTDYNRRIDGHPFDKSEFYEHPEWFESNFRPYSAVADMYIPCHYWDARAPYIFTRKEAKSPDFKIRIVADISCDIDGPVASTLRPSTIASPLYGYDPVSESETHFLDENAIGVMAIDNLPCELPKDSSEDFGNELIENIIPELLREDESAVIARATQTNLKGELTEPFAYLENYVKGEE